MERDIISLLHIQFI